MQRPGQKYAVQIPLWAVLLFLLSGWIFVSMGKIMHPLYVYTYTRTNREREGEREREIDPHIVSVDRTEYHASI